MELRAFLDLADRVRLQRLRLAGVRSHHLNTPAGRVHLLDGPGRGQRPPLVLLHGLGSCALDYEPVMLALRRHHRRVIAPDLGGHGLSPVPEGGMDPERLGDALVYALDEVLDEPAIVLGNSLGGLAAIRFAQRRPQKVLALLLASPGGAPMADSELASFMGSFRLDSHGQALHFVDRFLGRPNPLRQVFAWGVRARMSAAPIRELLERVSTAELLSGEELRALELPTLVFWGREDGILPETSRRFFHEHLRASFVEPGGFGHAPYLDHLGDFLGEVEAFLADPGSGPRGAPVAS